jgi:phosphotransferase system  glucose/maltose/N-acetylglucosamine-specific IIC component
MDMKKFPLTIIPLAIALVFGLIFIFVVPEGQDLISKTGDLILGLLVGIALGLCLVADLRRYRKRT